jgi:glycosyltransferase involved in cell wall biosynthesis
MKKQRKIQVSLKAAPSYNCASLYAHRTNYSDVDSYTTNESNAHWSQWIVERIKQLSDIFDIGTCAYFRKKWEEYVHGERWKCHCHYLWTILSLSTGWLSKREYNVRLKPKLKSKPKLVFFVTEDWYFVSHRLPLAKAAVNAGFEVVLVTRVRGHREVIEHAGARVVPLEIVRHGINPWEEMRTLGRVVSIYRNERPDVVHHVAVKPVLYGSIAARIAGVECVVNAMAGLGYLFVSSQLMARLLRRPVIWGMRSLLERSGSWLILQNADDAALFQRYGIVREKTIRLIKGSGVDLELFSADPPVNHSEPLVVLPARLLWDKGIQEFVLAAVALREQGVRARFVLAGDIDSGNPASVAKAQILEWKLKYGIEWWGRCDDMPEVLTAADIVCLPSYREGLPKALIEAAACARPLVATDVPGCREVVTDGDNGFLVPAREHKGLASALKRLIEDPAMRTRMGQRSRELAEERFGIDHVIEQTLAVYRELLS